MIFTIENVIVRKLKSCESFLCKKYIGIARKIKKTDQINIPELIQNKKFSAILLSSTFLSLYINQLMETKIKRTGRLMIEIKLSCLVISCNSIKLETINKELQQIIEILKTR
ncbi:hypothetical protein [uncultured Chryseobacterium sp.]|uniref:hypothetical protein n=1 Tax=uncultured Chryseobacterium sp. TaxID=259322 RepID=UPI0025DC99DA|nr:hypothetical protein [uncultured Chryseobacterium sp.]